MQPYWPVGQLGNVLCVAVFLDGDTGMMSATAGGLCCFRGSPPVHNVSFLPLASGTRTGQGTPTPAVVGFSASLCKPASVIGSVLLTSILRPRGVSITVTPILTMGRGEDTQPEAQVHPLFR